MSRPSTGSSDTTARSAPTGTIGRAVAVPVVLTGLLALGACTGSSSTPGGPTGSASGASAATSSPAVESPVAPPTHPQAKIPSAAQIVEQPILRKTIALTGCRSSKGGWQAVGTARNPTARAQSYHLLVFFTDKYSRVIDYARSTVDVGAGKTASWTAKASFDPPAATQCVLRGLYAGRATKR